MHKTSSLAAFRSARQKLTKHAQNSLLKADQTARRFGASETTNLHLLFGIFLEKGSIGSHLLSDLKFKKADFLRTLGEEKSPENSATSFIPVAPTAKDAFIRAFALAKKFNYPYVGTEHLAFAILNSADTQVKQLLTTSEIKDTARAMQSFFDPGQFSSLSKMLHLPEINTSKTNYSKTSTTPFIDKFCVDINQEVEKGDELVIGREKEISRIISILGRKNKNNPILIGDPGVGKTVLISGLAQRINAGAVPLALYQKKIMSLDIAQLIAGTSFRGEFEARLKEIIHEATTNQNIIIFIDELHNIVGVGNTAGSLDLANILKPALARGEIQLIGATTFPEYKKYIEKDAALERRFQPVRVNEPSQSEALAILLGIRKSYETFHNVSLSDEAISLAVTLSARYIQNRFLPDKAIDVIDETASMVRSKNKIPSLIRQTKELERQKIALLEEKERAVASDNYETAIALRATEKALTEKIKALRQKQSAAEKASRIAIDSQDIIATIAKMSGVPSEKISQAADRKIKTIEKKLNQQIVGQAEALQEISSTLLRSQSGITNPDRPLGSFLFLGPTGVGKTLTAKILAQEFFGLSQNDSHALVRIDMSELMERHSVSSLIGSPAGYVGYGEGGNLTEKIRRNPYSVVLFDEIEKAHPDVFNLLLQIMEDGLLTDAEGTQVSFKNTIIILTSNIGTSEFTQASAQIGFASAPKSSSLKEQFAAIRGQVLKELEQKMKPELLNRLDHIIVFNALDQKALEKIARLELSKLSARLREKNIQLTINQSVFPFLAKQSLDGKHGARLIRKNIQTWIENEIAQLVIHDKVKHHKINIDLHNEALKIA